MKQPYGACVRDLEEVAAEFLRRPYWYGHDSFPMLRVAAKSSIVAWLNAAPTVCRLAYVGAACRCGACRDGGWEIHIVQ